MQHIAMIGGGVAGTLVAMHLVRQALRPLCITLFDQRAQFQTGIAYAQSDFRHLLNVAAGKMSAWPDQPLHFVKWLQQQPAYANIDAALLAQTYLPRALYGQYLQQQWQQTVQEASSKNIQLQLLAVSVTKLSVLPASIALSSAQGEQQFDAVVIATGNELPRPPLPASSGLTAMAGYQHNPWQAFTITHSNTQSTAKPLQPDSRVLILGNGLTMVDTVLALRQAGVRSPIMSLSPHGYGMLPHRVSAVKLPDFASALGEQPSLRQALHLFNQQRKQLRQLGISAEGLVDNLRPYSQLWWRGFSTAEKQFFFKKLRHLWGVARHRLPLQIHDQIQQLRLQGALEVRAGRLLSCQQHDSGIDVRFIAKDQTVPELRQVDHIINCTGPETCYPQLANHLLATAITEGVLASGPLELGLAACPTSLALKNSSGDIHPRLFGIGSVLRGELWETTALNEIRQQAQQLAGQLLMLE